MSAFGRKAEWIIAVLMSLIDDLAKIVIGDTLSACLPAPAKAPPSGSGWIHEIKHDGFRILARRDSAGVRLITREVCMSDPVRVQVADRPSVDQRP